MAAAKKKVIIKKQKTAAKKVSKQTTAKKAVKTKAAVKAKRNVPGARIEPRAKPKPKVEKVKAKIKAVKAKATKTVAVPSKKRMVTQKKAVARKPAMKAVTARKPATPKKALAAASSSDRFRGLKSMLIAKRDALLNEAKQEIQKYVSGENRQLVDTAIDEADWAAVEISEDINLKRLSAQRQLLKDVEECLRKLSEGSYGICEDCNEEISEKRLRVIPTATLCIDCKEQREKMAILEQETEM